MTSKQLNSDDVLKTLAQNRQAIQNFGIRSLALFGSVAGDRATDDSDLDFLVEFEGATTFDRSFTQSQLQQSKSLSIDLAQNTETSLQSAEGYLKPSLDYIRSGQIEKALADLNQAIELNPNLAAILFV